MSTRNFFLIMTIISLSFNLFSQVHIYNLKANATHDLDSAITLAQQSNKHVFVQVGYNQCPWCILMHNFYTADKQVDSVLNIFYVPVLINYSRDNKNEDVMTRLKFPQRFGFPVIVILDTAGNVIHTQNTLYLEQDRGYNKDLFIDFLKNWNTTAINPESYN
ncbi:MAG: DUF255 domain-containing protein [Bacteroidales bacterium]|nr:DUF255 domain-containing protein [Bacteroidales bacterium]